MKYTVTNAGTGDIEKFSVVDDLPEGLVTIEGSKNLEFAVDGLEAGQTRAFEARLLATRAGEFSSRAVAKAANFDLQARSTNTSTRVRAAELNAEIEGPRSIYSGQPATFVGRVTNTGDFVANDVRVSVRWPAQAQLARLADPRMEAADQNRSRPQGSNGENETNPDNGSQPQVIKDIQNANTGQDQENQSNAQNQNQNRGNDQNNKMSNVRMDEEQFVIGTLEPNQTAIFEYVVQPYEMSQISTEIVAQYACDVGDAYELEQVKTATIACLRSALGKQKATDKVPVACIEFQFASSDSLALHLDFKALAIFSREERIGFGIADDFSLGRIPIESASQSHRDVREVANLEHTVMRPHVRNRLLPRSHALDEICAVVRRNGTTVDFFDRTFGQWVRFECLHRRSDNLAAVDEESAFGPFEKNPVVAFAGDDQFDAARHVGLQREISRNVVAVVDYGIAILILAAHGVFHGSDLDRAHVVVPERPDGDVDVVSAPVRQLATCILVPFPERIMAVAIKRNATTVAFSKLRQRAIVNLGSGPEPEIPIQSLRNRCHWNFR